MALPQQLRKQIEDVNKYYTKPNEADDADVQDEEVVTKAPDESNEEAEDRSASGQEEQTKSEDDAMLQKYRTLQGMYNAEVPKLHQQNKDLSSRLQQLEQLLASISDRPAHVEAKPIQVEKYVTDSDVNEYGDSIDVMRKVSREELGPVAQRIAKIEQMLQQMQANVVPKLETVAKQQAQSAEERFWSSLTAEVPNWQSVNNDPAFHNWLLETDPLTGTTRQAYLEQAQKALDSKRVAKFFNIWLGSNGEPAAAQSNRRTVSSELEKQVAPGRARGTGAQSKGQAKTYSAEDIRQFFKDSAGGKYKGREAERDRIERDIFLAQKEGRIV
jgi:hypothetical protein